MKIRIYNIEWDTDGEVIDDLPTEIIIDNPTDEMCEAIGGFDDVLADYLSDEYGFCVFGFNADFINDEEENNMKKITINLETATETQMFWVEEMLKAEIEEARSAASNEHIFALGSDEESEQHHQNAEENREYAEMLENALSQLKNIQNYR